MAAPDSPSRVLFVDLWHLYMITGSAFPSCPRTKPLAFAHARRMDRDEFGPADRIFLVTFACWPDMPYGWIR